MKIHFFLFCWVCSVKRERQPTEGVHTQTHPPTTTTSSSSNHALLLLIHSVCLAVIWKQNHKVLDQRVNLSIVAPWQRLCSEAHGAAVCYALFKSQ